MATLPSLAEFGGGALFGAALFASGVSNPSVISAQMHLTSFHMIKSMLAASAVSAIVVHVADRTRYAASQIRNPQNLGFFTFDGNVVGGAMIGVGMAMTGACPGTVFVQVGAGLASGVSTMCGGILGGLAYVVAKPSLDRLRNSRKTVTVSTPGAGNATLILSSARLKSLTVHGTFNLSPVIMLLIWECICILALRLITTLEPRTMSATRNSFLDPIRGVGVSKAFEDIGRWIQTIAKAGTRGTLTSAIMFAGGVVAGSALAAHGLPPAPLESTANFVTPSAALFGGALMAFGARVAGGCTSGHGISGLVTFSWASFVSVAAMFAGGVATAALV
ncbi:hypothetical protein MBLNU459_g6981t1 [Dothideomycetes sp. NU459]